MIYDKNYMELNEGKEVIYNQDRYKINLIDSNVMILDAVEHKGFVKVPIWDGKICENIESCFILREKVL